MDDVRRRRMTDFLQPRAIAIVGASQRTGSIGRLPLDVLTRHGFPGSIYPVNPNHEQLLGHRCYPDLSAAPDDTDLVIYAIGPEHLLATLETCEERGISAMSVFTAGFAEAGPHGRALQEELAAFANRAGIVVMGPNCQGTVSVVNSVAATFNLSFCRGDLKAGSTALVSQSGSFGATIFGLAQDAHVGFSHWINTGNEAVLSVTDWLEYLIEDSATAAIALYIEGVKDGRRFLELLHRARAADKHVVIFKVGRTDEGARAALTHTASLTGSHAVFESACLQAGALLVEDEDQLTDVLMLLQDSSPLQTNQIGVVTTSGGAAIHISDQLVEQSLEVPELVGHTAERVRELLPAFVEVQNPVDLTAQVLNDAELFPQVLDALLADPSLGGTVVLFGAMGHGQGDTAVRRIVDQIIEVKQRATDPLVVNWTIPPEEIFHELRRAGVPVFRNIRRTAEGLVRLRSLHRNEVDDSSAVELPDVEHDWHADALTEVSVKRVLSQIGLDVPGSHMRHEVASLGDAATDIGYPVVLKVVSPDIGHKVDVGGVVVGIADQESLEAAHRQMVDSLRELAPQARIDGYLVESMVPAGESTVELIVGTTFDEVFGPVVVVGAGGTLTELLDDTAVRIAPVSRAEARAMLKQLRVHRLLTGARGQAASDIDAAVEAIVRIGQLAYDHRDAIREIDVNPLLVTRSGAWAVDGLIVLHEHDETE